MEVFHGRDVYHFNPLEVIEKLHHQEPSFEQFFEQTMTLIPGRRDLDKLSKFKLDELLPLPSGSPLQDLQVWSVINDDDIWFTFILILDEQRNLYLSVAMRYDWEPETKENFTLQNRNDLILTNVIRMVGARAFQTSDGSLFLLDINLRYDDQYFDVAARTLPSPPGNGWITDFAVDYFESEHPLIFVVLNDDELYALTRSDKFKLLMSMLDVKLIDSIDGINILKTELRDVRKIRAIGEEFVILKGDGTVRFRYTKHNFDVFDEYNIIDIMDYNSVIVALREDGCIGIFFFPISDSRYAVRWMEEWGTGFTFEPRKTATKSSRS